MKMYKYLLLVITLIFTSCAKDGLLTEEPIGVDPNDFNIELQQVEFRKIGEQWSSIINGDTLKFNWSLFPPLSEKPLNLQFGPGNFEYSSNGQLLDIGTNGIFNSKGDSVFFSIYDNLTKEATLLESGKFNIEGDYFYLKKKELEIKFRILKGHYKP